MPPKRKGRTVPRKTGKNVSRRLKYRRATRLKYLRFIIPEGQRLQRKIIRNYWRYLTFNSSFHSGVGDFKKDSLYNQMKELVGIVIVPNTKNSVVRGVVEYPPFREIINDISVVENSILETALVSKVVLVFGDAPTLYRLQKTLGYHVKFSGQAFWKKIFYVPNIFLPEDRRAMIWYTFRYINKAVEAITDLTYLKYFYHFCYESFDTGKYYRLIRDASPLQSVIFQSEGASFLNNSATPIMLSALDIFKIRRIPGWDPEEFMKRAYHPRVINLDIIHDFTTKSGIVDYLRSGDTYIEDREYVFRYRLRRKAKAHEISGFFEWRDRANIVGSRTRVRLKELQLRQGQSVRNADRPSIGIAQEGPDEKEQG